MFRNLIASSSFVAKIQLLYNCSPKALTSCAASKWLTHSRMAPTVFQFLISWNVWKLGQSWSEVCSYKWHKAEVCWVHWLWSRDNACYTHSLDEKQLTCDRQVFLAYQQLDVFTLAHFVQVCSEWSEVQSLSCKGRKRTKSLTEIAITLCVHWQELRLFHNQFLSLQAQQVASNKKQLLNCTT